MPRKSRSRAIRQRNLSNGRYVRQVGPTARLELRLAEAVGIIVAKHSDPGRILELYYWSRAPGLCELIRAVLAVNEEAREAVRGFLTTVPDPRSIAVVQLDSHVLTLAAPAQAPRVREAA